MTLTRETITWEQAVGWLRAQPNQAALVRACYFDDPLVDAARRFHESLEWRAVRDFLPASCGMALDVGAGRGIASFALAADGWRVTALEPDPSRLVGAGAIRELASQAAVNITVVEEWGEKLPFEDGSFDLIHARQVLHHARDLEALCQELTRVLKPKGMLIATREHVIDKPEDLPVFLDSHPLHHLYGGENAYTRKRYLGAFEDAGLRMRHVLSPWETPVNYFPMTELDVRRAVSNKLRFPFPALLPAALICWVSKRLRSPGRLYSFVGVKL
ncbi:Methyltransferase type 11 [Desulfomicrobium baculatum DSM 4028]|uniref:Methyltransferase type 11 n=1 Tax=Desulfomicrobium baculatum (strain DSM 4028 / VKM B-1378 / X) TaxID=525897 RepID=C7LP42_DESBD|nr:Methyltransferase type 11 [Desulfomicrobium baculatum DSM 4028]